jgi:putative nucleotidyltransferase with HDIG domain
MRNPRSAAVRIYGVPALALTAGVGVLIGLGRFGELPESANQDPSTLLLWLTLVTAAAISPIPLPRTQASFSVAPALEFAGTLLFGPLVGCWIAVLGALVSNAVNKWNPLPASLNRLGQSLLAVGTAGLVYTALGGHFGTGILDSGGQLVPVLAGAATYLAVRSSAAAFHAFLATARISLRPWWGDVALVAAMEAFVLPFGALLAVTQERIGPVGVALFLIPLLLARYSFRLWNESRTAHLETVRTLMSAIDAADPFTWGLSYRVSKMSLAVGRRLGLSDRDLEELEYAALLHDIGRTAIKREILLKPGQLTEREQAALRTHPQVGAEILARLHFFPSAPEIVHCHHEQPDGRGYPRGLARSDIPVGSQVIMAVAAFDAMTSDRPYRRGLSPDEAFDELLRHAGSQFFPEVVEALSLLWAQGRLFEQFDPDMLAAYADGPGASRAITEHLRRTDAGNAVPGKLGTAGGTAPTDDEADGSPGAPLAEGPVLVEKEIQLDDSGAYRFLVAGLSDVGCVRGNNEDSFGVFETETPRKGCLMVLADGMGGAAAGEVASRLAVDAVGAHYLTDRRRHRAQESLRAAIQVANRTVHERSSSQPGANGMGTTCTAAGISGNGLVVGHVGDSRAYLVRRQSVERLTADHTLESELRELGRSAAMPPGAHHVLTRCLGNQPDVEVDVTPRIVRLEEGEAVVLCSDGLPAVVEDGEILAIVGTQTPPEACRGLIELARSRGAPDNVTVVVGVLKAA